MLFGISKCNKQKPKEPIMPQQIINLIEDLAMFSPDWRFSGIKINGKWKVRAFNPKSKEVILITAK